jgi:hypothetical protein
MYLGHFDNVIHYGLSFARRFFVDDLRDEPLDGLRARKTKPPTQSKQSIRWLLRGTRAAPYDAHEWLGRAD